MMSEFWALYLTLLAFFFGASIGSFLNVCIYRIPREESVVHPRSHCPNCNTMIAWYDNIPLVSYLVLRARCRHCGQGITPRYVLVELLTAVLFLLVWNRYGFDVRTLVYWLVVSGLILGTFVDFEHMIIPDRVSLGGIATGLVLSALVPSLHGKDAMIDGLISAAIGAAVGSGSLWAVAEVGRWIFKKDAMGLGDVKLLGGIGAYLGWQGVVFTIIVSSFVGSIVGVSLILTARKEWQSRIPYGPYLAAAALIWILGGSAWWNAYVRWLSGYPG